MLALTEVLEEPGSDKAARYSAHLPWIGPVLGPGPRDRALVTVGGAADPKLGNALAAVLVPVIREGDRFQPSDPTGLKADLAAVARFAWLKSDANGLFRVEAPEGLWEGVAGVWMLLLYERSGRVSHRLDKLHTLSASDLPHEMTGPIRDILAKAGEEAELGLIELDRAHRPDTITFAVGSCQYPAGFLDRDVAELSYKRLASRLEEKDPAARPSCLLLLGDQVYIDATAGLFDPTAAYDKYHLPYERLLRMTQLRHVLRRIPAYMMLDDHEIEDNWEPLAGDKNNAQSLIDGRRSYLAYQRIAGPEQTKPVGDSTQPLWYEFEVNGFPFFITDSRTERDPRTVETIENAQIMREGQFAALLNWLVEHNNEEKQKPKFIASSVSLLPRHRRATCSPAGALRSDGWDGYPASLRRLLGFIAKKDIKDVVFLSGDEHISFVARAVLRNKDSGKATVIHSIHTSALYAPFLFANSIQDNLAWRETFDFHFENQAYSCEVSKEFTTLGDGVSVLKVFEDGEGWKLDYRFLRADAPKAEEQAVICTSR